MICFNGVKGSGEGEKFVEGLISYVDYEIKGDIYKKIVSSK